MEDYPFKFSLYTMFFFLSPPLPSLEVFLYPPIFPGHCLRTFLGGTLPLKMGQNFFNKFNWWGSAVVCLALPGPWASEPCTGFQKKRKVEKKMCSISVLEAEANSLIFFLDKTSF